jgi:hypothetical protein
MAEKKKSIIPPLLSLFLTVVMFLAALFNFWLYNRTYDAPPSYYADYLNAIKIFLIAGIVLAVITFLLFKRRSKK